MKRIFLIIAVFLSLGARAFAATGSITGITVDPQGWDIYVTFTGFSPFGTLNTGMTNLTGGGSGNNPANATIVLTVTPPAYTPVAGMNSGPRTVHGTWPVRYAYPNAWASATSYALNATVSDGTYIQKVIACAGSCTSAATHPTWNTALGGTAVDNAGSNQITWQDMGTLPHDGALNTCFDENTSVGGSLTVRIALDEDIYATDTLVVANIAAGLYTDNGSGGTGGASLAATNFTVTNNSTLAYPKPIARWTSVPYQRVTSPFVLEMTGASHWAQNRNEFAAITYTCTDNHSHSNSVTVSQMSISSLFTDANPVIVYAATMPITGFTEGDRLTCNALVYPFFGDSNSVLNTAVGADGYAQPAETLGPQYEVNDPTGAYGYAYAAVLTTGSDSTCTGHVFNTRAAAEADTGFASVTKAASCLEAYDNTNYSRADAGGGLILLGANSAWGYCATSGSALGAMETWLTVDKISTLSPSQVVIATGPGASNHHCDSDGNTLLKFQNFTFNGNTTGLFYANATGTDSLWLHNVNFTQNGTGSASAAFMVFPGAIWTTQSNFGTFTQGFVRYAGSYRTPWAMVRGATCGNPEPSQVYTVVGNKNVIPSYWVATGDATLATNDGAVVAFDTMYAITSATPVSANGTAQAPTPHGTAWVQLLAENIAPNGFFWSAGTTSTTNNDNWVIQHVTTPCGANPCVSGNPGTYNRTAYGYAIGSTVTRYNWSFKWNAVSWRNSKSDDYPPQDSLAVNNWPLVYSVGMFGNADWLEVNLSIEYWGNGACEGNGVLGVCAPGFINDLSGGAGNGNYHLTSTSAAINIAPWTNESAEVIPFDIEGHPRVGRSVAGAYTFGTARRGWR